MSSTTPSTEKQSTIGRELASGLIGAVVSVCCIFPPILHLVTGPLGPFIGGFVAANRVQPTPRARFLVALTIATTLATFIASALSVASSIAAANELPDWFPATPTRIAVVTIVVWTYAGTLAAVGTITRSAVARSQAAAPK
jgi:hypothetical protein